MPIPQYTPQKLKKIKKDDLIIHILELYTFLDIFDGNEIIEELKEDLNKSALIMIECQRFMCEEEEKNQILTEENEKLKEQIEKLKNNA